MRHPVDRTNLNEVGMLDAPNDLRVVMNIWTNSRRPWLYRDPTIEQHPENRPVPPRAAAK
jgi:hypothetical protein